MPAVKEKRESRLQKVAKYLVDHQFQWVPGYDIASKEVGGSEGLRRLRYLRDDLGWPIEMRPMEDSTAMEYRLN